MSIDTAHFQEELEDGVVRLAPLRRRSDAHLPGITVPTDDAGGRSAGGDSQPQSCRGRNHAAMLVAQDDASAGADASSRQNP